MPGYMYPGETPMGYGAPAPEVEEELRKRNLFEDPASFDTQQTARNRAMMAQKQQEAQQRQNEEQGLMDRLLGFFGVREAIDATPQMVISNELERVNQQYDRQIGR